MLDHTGSATYAANVEFLVGDGAQLTVVVIAGLGRRRRPRRRSTRSRVGRDARFKRIVVTLGGDLVRVAPEARFAAPGGDAELLGLYFADAGQHLEHRLFVDHAVPHCRSHVIYKGALQGEEAHTVWIGDVLIRAAAEGTDTYELNRNLVLTDGARADSVPNLEIETGEIVGAGHASATGRFDDEQLFYLQSRGIPEDEARRLVVRGFFADVISQIGIPEVAGAAARARSRLSSRERCTEHGRDRRVRPGLRRRGRPRRRARSASSSTASRSPSSAATARSTPSTTSARTPRSRCPRARSTDQTIECWLHGSRFDLRTGQPDRPAGHPARPRLPREDRRRRRPRVVAIPTTLES